MSTHPPGPRGLPVVGNSNQYARDPFRFLESTASAYGDVIRFDLGPVETYMITNPRDIERVLVSDDARYRKPDFQDAAFDGLLGDGLLMSEGELWHTQRQLAQPAFAPDRIGGLAAPIWAHADAMVEGWDDGTVIDAQLSMARVTVQIIVEAMFGTTLDDTQVTTIQENLEPLGQRFEPDPLRFLLPDWAPTPENREYNRSLATLEELLGEIVSGRRGTVRDPSIDAAGTADELPMDLVSILLRAAERGEQSDEQLRDELMTMLLAGHDTTALTLTYTWYLLSEHPDVEAQLIEEIDATVGRGRPTLAAVREIDLLDRVLNEAMRLYPPVYIMFREPVTDVRLGGYRIPRGAAVLLPQWVVHRSPRWYDAPERFDPERWRRERRAERPRFAFFPFGGGPRHCIGKHLSLVEAKLIITRVLQEYRLSYTGDGPFELRGSLTMHPDRPLPMRVERRSG